MAPMFVLPCFDWSIEREPSHQFLSATLSKIITAKETTSFTVGDEGSPLSSPLTDSSMSPRDGGFLGSKDTLTDLAKLSLQVSNEMKRASPHIATTTTSRPPPHHNPQKTTKGFTAHTHTTSPEGLGIQGWEAAPTRQISMDSLESVNAVDAPSHARHTSGLSLSTKTLDHSYLGTPPRPRASTTASSSQRPQHTTLKNLSTSASSISTDYIRRRIRRNSIKASRSVTGALKKASSGVGYWGGTASSTVAAAASPQTSRHTRASSMVTPIGTPLESTLSPAASFLAQFNRIDSHTTLSSQEPLGVCQGDWIDGYLIGRRLGHGAFSEVFEVYAALDEEFEQLPFLQQQMSPIDLQRILAEEQHHGEDPPLRLAAKVVRRDQIQAHKQFQVELSVWRQLDHPHLLPLLDVVECDAATLAVCPLVDAGSLLDWLTGQSSHSAAAGPLSERAARRVVRALTAAIFYLHEEARIIHRDIKLDNCLLTREGHVFLSDFGLCVPFVPDGLGGAVFPAPFPNGHRREVRLRRSHSQQRSRSKETEGDLTCLSPLSCASETPLPDPINSVVDEDGKTFCVGTVQYCAPEEIDPAYATRYSERLPAGTRHYPQSDLWSLGVCVYAMLAGRLPFDDDFVPRLQLQILRGIYPPLPTGTSDAACDLVRGLLTVDMRDRYTVREVMTHPWLCEPLHESL